MNEFVAISFRLINFGITIVAGFYLFKRYGLNFILEKIKERQKKIENLNLKIKKINEEEQAKEQIAEQQKKLYSHLQKKLSIWTQAFNQALARRQEEKKNLEFKLQKKVHIQEIFLQEQYLQRDVMPKALKQAHDALEKKFAHVDTGKFFVNRLIHNLKKSVQ